MANMKAKYLGDLRVECTHLASGTTLVTDAPVDNQGKGEDRACSHGEYALCNGGG